MIVHSNLDEINKFNTYFCGFHDGLIANLTYLTGFKAKRNFPWETPDPLPSDLPSILHSYTFSSISSPQIRLRILHFNYNWPNTPPKRTIDLICSGVEKVSSDLLLYIGHHIFDLELSERNGGIEVILSRHDKKLVFRSMENATKISLFTCLRIKVRESEVL